MGTAYTGSNPEDAGELLPGTLVGEYRIEGTLGAGGMGRVYSAIHPVIAKKAAIKVLHPQLSMDQEAIQRFVQEARSVNQIGHPNIVDIFSFGALPDGRQYFVMEWLRGMSLRDRLHRGRLDLDEALQLVETITLPLEAAHEHGIVHRDLKPDNVYLVDVKGDRPQVKLLDFGIAKLHGPEKITNTRTGNMLGTPAYMSPEQARGEGVDHRTDIYALGAMLFEMCCGEMVYNATNVADMIGKHLYEPPRRPSMINVAISPTLDAVILRMLEKSSANRPQLDEIRAALKGCRHALGSATPIHGVPVQSQPQYTPSPGQYTPSGYTPPPAQYTPGPMTPSQVGPLLPPTAPTIAAYGVPTPSHVGPAPGLTSPGQPAMPTATVTPAKSGGGGRFAVIALVALVVIGGGIFGIVKATSSDEAAVDKPADPVTAPVVDKKPEVKPEVKPEAKPEVKPETKPEVVETKPEVKPETKPEVVETKPETKKPKNPKLPKNPGIGSAKPDPGKGSAKPDPGKGSAKPDAGSAKPRDPDAPL